MDKAVFLDKIRVGGTMISTNMSSPGSHQTVEMSNGFFTFYSSYCNNSTDIDAGAEITVRLYHRGGDIEDITGKVVECKKIPNIGLGVNSFYMKLEDVTSKGKL